MYFSAFSHDYHTAIGSYKEITFLMTNIAIISCGPATAHVKSLTLVVFGDVPDTNWQLLFSS